LPVAGWETTSGRPLSTVWSKDEVDTLQVSLARFSVRSHDGRFLKKRVDEAKMVKPVFLGEAVAPSKIWNL
jgi:hypothetical protein